MCAQLRLTGGAVFKLFIGPLDFVGHSILSRLKGRSLESRGGNSCASIPFAIAKDRKSVV